MSKALAIISLASVVAIVTMAIMVLTSYSHREEVQLQQEILATKTAESRDFPTTIDREDAIDLVDDSAFPETSEEPRDLPGVRRKTEFDTSGRSQGRPSVVRGYITSK